MSARLASLGKGGRKKNEVVGYLVERRGKRKGKDGVPNQGGGEEENLLLWRQKTGHKKGGQRARYRGKKKEKKGGANFYVTDRREKKISMKGKIRASCDETSGKEGGGGEGGRPSHF